MGAGSASLSSMRTYEVETLNLVHQPAAVVRATVAVAEIGVWMSRALGAVAAHLASAGAHPAGPPFGRFHLAAGERFEVEAGFPTAEPVPEDGGVQLSSLPAGLAAATWHVGPYDEMTGAYAAVTAWIRDHDGEPVGDAWEVYFTDPAREPDPATWRTLVVQPYRQV